MAEQTEYRTPRSFRIAGVGLGLAFAAFLSLKLIFDPSQNAIGNYAVAAVVSGCLALAVYSLRAFLSPHAYSVVVSEDGMRMGTSGRWIMWSDIRSIRENALFGRVDLIDYENRRLGSVQHRIEEFHSLLRLVRNGMRRYAMTRPPRRHFGSRARATAALAVFVVGMSGLFVYVYVTDAEHPWWALPAIPVYVLFAYMKTRDEVRQLDILDDVMIFSTVWRTRRCSREMIGSVRTVLYDNDVVQPRVVLHDGRELNVAPAGSDVLEVYGAVSDWFEERDAHKRSGRPTIRAGTG